MLEPIAPKAGVATSAPHIDYGRERILGISDVCAMTGLAKATASKLMKETGCAFKVHSRLFVIESSFFSYLHELEVTKPCNL